jgi:RNA-directed DNA polymerase
MSMAAKPTRVNKTLHAPDTSSRESKGSTGWDAIPWPDVKKKVERLQMRIAKATREGKHRKANSLQWILTHSYYAKLLAVKRVTTNKGKRTAGVDGVIWKTSAEKLAAVDTLNRHGYKPLPLRRKYIPKRNSNKKRPLGIPTMRDRAMQALYAMALKPIAETLADPNSYGFRDKRNCHDAIQQVFIALAKSYSAEWILEGDIKSCFDEISHQWMLENIPMDKKILKAWLKAGYVDEGKLYPSISGTPQGGVISPILANMTLDGLEKTLYGPNKCNRQKVNVIRFADDFVTTGRTKELLENQALPAAKAFLEPRGLKLSEEKTLITNINDGFDFLGFNVRKYNGKLLIKPSKKAVKSLLDEVRVTIKSHLGVKPEVLIVKLNLLLKGWVNYHRHVVAKKTFSYVDWQIDKMIKGWMKRRHPTKGMKWIHNKYFHTNPIIGTTFAVRVKTQDGKFQLYALYKAAWTTITRHIKIKQQANPFDPEYAIYFKARKGRNYTPALERQDYLRVRSAVKRQEAIEKELYAKERAALSQA